VPFCAGRRFQTISARITRQMLPPKLKFEAPMLGWFYASVEASRRRLGVHPR
jgi:hypothetical protein